MKTTRKYKILQIFTLILALLAGPARGVLWAQEKPLVTVAAAADLEPALRELATQFEIESGARVELVFGSSGNLTTQIENGAPFDVFLSADREHPERLIAAGKAGRDSEKTYAIGKLVVWMPSSVQINIKNNGLLALAEPSIKKIAIANPAHAPYGRAAVAALKHYQIYEKLAGKLVLGENVSQAAQFAATGNAQAAIIALSLVQNPAMQNGRDWLVPADAYPPLEQVMVIVSASRKQLLARRFSAFMTGPRARDVLGRYGFAFPAAGAKR